MQIRNDIELEGGLDDVQRARPLEIAGRCEIHRAMRGEIRIESRLI